MGGWAIYAIVLIIVAVAVFLFARRGAPGKASDAQVIEQLTKRGSNLTRPHNAGLNVTHLTVKPQAKAGLAHELKCIEVERRRVPLRGTGASGCRAQLAFGASVPLYSGPTHRRGRRRLRRRGLLLGASKEHKAAPSRVIVVGRRDTYLLKGVPLSGISWASPSPLPLSTGLRSSFRSCAGTPRHSLPGWPRSSGIPFAPWMTRRRRAGHSGSSGKCSRLLPTTRRRSTQP